jgi:hypothetical protein
MKWRDRAVMTFVFTSALLVFSFFIRVGLDCLEVLGWLN